MSTALNMLLKQSIREQVSSTRPVISYIPNTITMQATEHAEAIHKGETPEDGVVSDNADDAVKFLDTLV